MNYLKIKKLLAFSFMLLITANLISCDNEKKSEMQPKTESPGNENKKQTESGNNFIATYDITGKMNGTMTIYKNGSNLKQKINADVMGMKNTINTYVVGDEVYNVTQIGDKKFGNKTSLKEYNAMKQTGETITDFKEFEKFISGKKIIGTETIIDHSADIYDMGNGMSISVYDKKYILRIKNPDFMAVATKLDMNPVITLNEFEVPKDVDYKSIGPSKISKDILDSLTKIPKK